VGGLDLGQAGRPRPQVLPITFNWMAYRLEKHNPFPTKDLFTEGSTFTRHNVLSQSI
jgi:hypothetical protein